MRKPDTVRATYSGIPMRAAVLTGPGQLEVRDILPAKAHGGAIVEIEAAGICGTDHKIADGSIPVQYPRVMGHELVGIVTAARTGPVTTGARVMIDPATYCGRCPTCRAGRENICPRGGLMGRDFDGGFAERVVVQTNALIEVPASIDSDAATLLQVLGTCIHAQRDTPLDAQRPVVVYGLGVAGILHVQLLKDRGFRTVIGVERSPKKRKLAEELGASLTASPRESTDMVRETCGELGPGLVIEAVGKVDTLARCIEMAGNGATLVAYGTISETRTGNFPFYEMYRKELRVLNPRAATKADYRDAIALAADHRVALPPLCDRSFSLPEAVAAMDYADGGHTLKTTIRP